MRAPSQAMAKASPNMRFMRGSTTLGVMEVASAASTALPRRASIGSPAAEASGYEVLTTLPASSDTRCGG